MLNIKNEERYIKVLCGLFLFVLVVLAVLGKNIIDYVYIIIIFTLVIESFKK